MSVWPYGRQSDMAGMVQHALSGKYQCNIYRMQAQIEVTRRFV